MRHPWPYAGMIAVLVGVGLLAWWLATAGTSAGGDAGAALGRPPGPSPSPCPAATPEMLWVEPVDSPTGCLSQVISVMIGNGEYVSVTSESGTVAVTGTFSIYSPARVDMPLLPGTTHHLLVAGRVRVVWNGDCQYGGYTLFTSSDRFGNPLVIVQEGSLCPQIMLPLLFKVGGKE